MELQKLTSVFQGLLFDGGYLTRPELLVRSGVEPVEAAAAEAAPRKPKFEPMVESCSAPRLGASPV